MQLYTREQLAKALDVTTRTIDRWARSHILPAPIRLGHRLYWTAENLAQYIALLPTHELSKPKRGRPRNSAEH